MPNIIRQTRAGSESLPWIRALVMIAHEGRMGAAEVQEGLEYGAIKTHEALYSRNDDCGTRNAA
jgi:hypothetical protein